MSKAALEALALEQERELGFALRVNHTSARDMRALVRLEPEVAET